MLFTSISFLYYFLPTIIILYFITPKKYRNYILLIFSIIFYMYGEPKYVILMLVEILVAYFGALLIDKYKSKEIFLISGFFVYLNIQIFLLARLIQYLKPILVF